MDLYLQRWGPEGGWDELQLTTSADVLQCALAVADTQHLVALCSDGTDVLRLADARLGEGASMGTLIAGADSPACAFGLNGRLHVAYRDTAAERLRYDYSDDLGATVSGAPVTVVATAYGDPIGVGLTQDDYGRLVLVVGDGTDLVTYRSTDSGESWSEVS
jgi:hypothetical protein